MEQKKFEFSEMNFDDGMNMGANCNNYGYCQQPSAICQPVQECPQERVCHRYLCYEVPHIIPCNTRIINHHVYKHTYSPCYTSCEENVCENIYEPKRCF